MASADLPSSYQSFWKTFETSIRNFHSKAENSFIYEELYRGVYNLVLHKQDRIFLIDLLNLIYELSKERPFSSNELKMIRNICMYLEKTKYPHLIMLLEYINKY